MPSYINFLDISRDEWTRYRYVKDVEENSSFSEGDTVKIVGTSIEGYGEHIGNNADVVRIFSGGDVRVSNKIGENNYMDNIYPPSSLELIEKQRQSITKELSQTVESNAIALDKATRNKINEVAKGESETEKRPIFVVMEYSFSHQGLVNKKEVDRHGTLDRAIAVSEGLNNRNRKCFYSVDGILV